MKKFAFAAVLLATVAAPASANVVVNGGFETGDFTGWTLFGSTTYTHVVGGTIEVPPPGGGGGGGTPLGASDFIYDGTYAAEFGPVGGIAGIYQSVMTTAGAGYTLTFALKNDGGTPNSFSVSFNGTELEGVTNGDETLGYELHSFNLIGTGEAAELRFSFRQDPDYWYLDAVSLEGGDTSDVPEPAMLGLFGLGALGLGLARRRKA